MLLDLKSYNFRVQIELNETWEEVKCTKKNVSSLVSIYVLEIQTDQKIQTRLGKFTNLKRN